MEVKAVLRIAYSNQKPYKPKQHNFRYYHKNQNFQQHIYNQIINVKHNAHSPKMTCERSLKQVLTGLVLLVIE
jgi:hypothetical protein